MKHKIRAILLLIIFSLSITAQAASAATYYINSPEEEVIQYNLALANNEREFTLEYNPDTEEDEYIINMLSYQYSLQEDANSDYGFYNMKSIGYSYYNRAADYTVEGIETPEQTQYVFDTLHKLIKDNLFIAKASNFEKAAWAYDYIVSHYSYDYSMQNYSAYGALKDGRTVCQGYALLFYALATELGLNCRIVSGIAGTTEKGDHAWNLLELGGQWYCIDTTWGACGYGRDFFLVLKSKLDETHTLDPIYENYYDFATVGYVDNGGSGFRGVMGSVYNVKFDLLKKNTLYSGEIYTWMQSNPSNIALTYTSDDTNVATVSDRGDVIGVGAGTTTVRAINESLGIEQICVITVDNTDVNVIGTNNISVNYKKTASISLTVSPSNAKLQNVTYRSKDEEIATVDSNGIVTGVRAGVTTIEVTYGDYKKAKVLVTVTPIVNKNYKNISVTVKKTKSIKNAVTVSDKGYKDLSYKTSNKNVAKVSSTGIVTGVKKGSCSIKIYDKTTKQLVSTVKVTVNK